MKKRILRASAGLVVLTALTLTSCELLEECGTCELVTEENGEITYGTPLYYCGDALIEKQNSTPTTVLGVTTSWNCY